MTKAYLPPVMADVIIDLSHYQTVSQDFSAAVASGVAAVVLKASQGTGFIDPTFLPRAAEAQASGLLVGAYHFLDGSNPSEQMAHFLSVAHDEAGLNWLAIDWEPYPASPASVMGAAQAVATVHTATGKWPVLYTGRYMLSSPSAVLSNCPLWLPEYGTNPVCPPGWSKWALWQHTDGNVGSDAVPVAGIGRCDRSRFAGTIADLVTWWRQPQL